MNYIWDYMLPKTKPAPAQEETDECECRYCHRIFKNKSGRIAHEKTCKEAE